ncbi:MAG: hypothetical protein QW051_01580 [Candidatus Aenigmatarchaeota archaeon]
MKKYKPNQEIEDKIENGWVHLKDVHFYFKVNVERIRDAPFKLKIGDKEIVLENTQKVVLQKLIAVDKNDETKRVRDKDKLYLYLRGSQNNLVELEPSEYKNVLRQLFLVYKYLFEPERFLLQTFKPKDDERREIFYGEKFFKKRDEYIEKLKKKYKL